MGNICCCNQGQDEIKATNQANSHGVRNETEDPRAPLLTKKTKTPFDKELDEFVEGLSTDDEIIPNDEEIEAILNEKQE